MSELIPVCNDCHAPFETEVWLCPKHAAVDRLIQALERLVNLYPTHQTREWNQARALLDEIKEATK